MKRILGLMIGLLMMAGTAQAIVPVYNDVWDISQGAVVTNTSGMLTDGRDMFGGTYGYVEAGNALFADWQPDGYTHWIEWNTPNVINLTGFNLFAAHDGNNPAARAIREFRIFYKDGGNWTKFYTFDPTHPYGSGLYQNEFALSVNGLNINAQYFRAEFDQYGYTQWASGPRVYELDGFSNPVPEPGSLWMLGTGLLGFIGYGKARFSKKA